MSVADPFVEYIPSGRTTPVRCSDVSVDELIAAGFVTNRQNERLRRVLEVEAAGGNICDDEELLASWLHVFELLASVRPTEIPHWRSAG